jgi:hypothetical protein
MHRGSRLGLTIPQGTALTVLVPMSGQLRSVRLVDFHSQHTGRTFHVYISILSNKSQLAKVSHSKKEREGERANAEEKSEERGWPKIGD